MKLLVFRVGPDAKKVLSDLGDALRARHAVVTEATDHSFAFSSPLFQFGGNLLAPFSGGRAEIKCTSAGTTVLQVHVYLRRIAILLSTVTVITFLSLVAPGQFSFTFAIRSLVGAVAVIYGANIVVARRRFSVLMAEICGHALDHNEVQNDHIRTTQSWDSGTISLVLAILSFVSLGLLFSIPAVVIGHTNRRRMGDPVVGDRRSSTAALLGLVLGYLNIFVFMIFLAVLSWRRFVLG